jgi:uncharacterized protein (DUF983 family)
MDTKSVGKHTGLLKSIITNKCPHCRKGDLFIDPNPYHLRTTMRMPKRCAVCGQLLELQTGFYFGTGYVSYGLSVLFIIFCFVAWYFTLHLSLMDNSIFWCMGFSALLLVILQPPMQRLARSVWIACFVYYDPNYYISDTGNDS